jgi:hypothetical protein
MDYQIKSPSHCNRLNFLTPPSKSHIPFSTAFISFMLIYVSISMPKSSGGWLWVRQLGSYLFPFLTEQFYLFCVILPFIYIPPTHIYNPFLSLLGQLTRLLRAPMDFVEDEDLTNKIGPHYSHSENEKEKYILLIHIPKLTSLCALLISQLHSLLKI